jgi:hypothetical protein
MQYTTACDTFVHSTASRTQHNAATSGLRQGAVRTTPLHVTLAAVVRTFRLSEFELHCVDLVGAEDAAIVTVETGHAVVR